MFVTPVGDVAGSLHGWLQMRLVTRCKNNRQRETLFDSISVQRTPDVEPINLE